MGTLLECKDLTKSFSGKTVNQWISEALIRESEILLRNPDLTIQQVADMLNFSDQSSFGKFFKKHRDISPLAFKRQFAKDQESFLPFELLSIDYQNDIYVWGG